MTITCSFPSPHLSSPITRHQQLKPRFFISDAHSVHCPNFSRAKPEIKPGRMNTRRTTRNGYHGCNGPLSVPFARLANCEARHDVESHGSVPPFGCRDFDSLAAASFILKAGRIPRLASPPHLLHSPPLPAPPSPDDPGSNLILLFKI